MQQCLTCAPSPCCGGHGCPGGPAFNPKRTRTVLNRHLRQKGQTASVGASLYLSGVLAYLTAEILTAAAEIAAADRSETIIAAEAGSNAGRRRGRSKIVPSDVIAAVSFDEELSCLFPVASGDEEEEEEEEMEEEEEDDEEEEEDEEEEDESSFSSRSSGAGGEDEDGLISGSVAPSIFAQNSFVGFIWEVVAALACFVEEALLEAV